MILEHSHKTDDFYDNEICQPWGNSTMTLATKSSSWGSRLISHVKLIAKK
jgi:hypothetical protein